MDKKKLFLASLGHLSCDVNAGAVPAVLPFLIAAYSFNYQSAAGLVFALSCFASIIQPVFGYFADKTSKPWFIPLGVLLAGSGIASIGFLHSYWAIFAAIAVSGVGSALFHPEAARYANRVSGERKGLGLSLFSIGGSGGFVVGPLIAVAAVSAFGLAGTLVFGVLALFTAGTLLYQIAHLDSLPSHGATPGAADRAAGAGEASNDWKAFSRLTGAIFARSVLAIGFNTFIPLYWIHVFGQSETVGGFVLTCFCAFCVFSNFLGGFLSDRVGYVRLIRFSCVGMIPLCFLFSSVTEPVTAIALLVPLGLAISAPFSSMVVLGQRYLGKNMGFASGVTLGLGVSLGGMTIPVLGWIADTYGLGSAIQCMGGVAVVGMICAFLLSPQRELATQGY